MQKYPPELVAFYKKEAGFYIAVALVFWVLRVLAAMGGIRRWSAPVPVAIVQGGIVAVVLIILIGVTFVSYLKQGKRQELTRASLLVYCLIAFVCAFAFGGTLASLLMNY